MSSMLRTVHGMTALLVAGVGLLHGTADAQTYTDNEYRFAVGTVTADTANYDVALGGQVDVELYLRETLGDPGNDFLLVDEDGLASAAFVLDWVIETGSGDPTAVASGTDVAINPAFDDPFVEQIDLGAGGLDMEFGRDAILQTTGVAPVVDGQTASVHLATLTFTAGTPLVVTRVEIDDRPSGDQTLTWQSQVPLDEQLSPESFTITTPIPEPASGLLTAAAGAALLLRRRRA